MKYQELISYEKKYGECKNDLLIIIPCFINFDILIKHLGYLSKQTFQKFDAVLVLGKDFDDTKLSEFLKSNKFNFGIILIKRKEDTGSAGGFFTGQKYGFEKGYAYMINADDDCMPIDSNLIGSLYSNKNVGYVYSTSHLLAGDKGRFFIGQPCIAQYTLLSRSIFEKYGFCYAPLYCGSEDYEFSQRIANEKSFILPNVTEHPFYYVGRSVLRTPSRTWLYILSNLIVMKLTVSKLISILFFGIFLSLSLFFIPMYGPRLFIMMTNLVLSYRFGKEAFNKIDSSIKKTIFPKNEIPANLEILEDTSSSHFWGNFKKDIFNILKESLIFFRKDVLITDTFNYLKIFVLGCFCRTLYFKMDEDHYMLISNNQNIVFHVAKLLILPIFAAFYCGLLLLVFIPLKILKQPRTMRYGLD